MLSVNEMQKLLVRFPKVELSYDKLIHKKVYSDYCQAIPYGKKYFAWFTHYKNEDVCIFLETNYSLNIFDIFIRPVCFDNTLSYGTILYGTITNNRFFVTEDILHYKNKDVSQYNNISKLKLLMNIFKNEIKQVGYSNNDIVMTLPITKSSYYDLENELKYLPYNIYAIAFVKGTHKSMKYVYRYKNAKTLKAIFKVKADIQNDIYNLYCNEGSKQKFYQIAYIPDYKTSVMMNGLFRNISENINLDTLEESEDEEDFENIDLDKYVDLDKSYTMECVYNNKFKMWIPEKVVKNKSIIDHKQLFKFKKK